MKSVMSIAIYRSKEGANKKDFLNLLKRHHPVLKKMGLVTDHPVLITESGQDTWIEVFEWINEKAIKVAEQTHEVIEVWDKMANNVDFEKLSSLSEANTIFPHFPVVDLNKGDY